MIAEVIVPRPVFQRYHYRVPTEWEPFVSSGSRVKVPFGAVELIGLVARLLEDDKADLAELKPIHGVCEGFPLLDEAGFEFLAELSVHWVLSEGEAASLLLPRYVPPQKVLYQACENLQVRMAELPPRRHKFHAVLLRLWERRQENFEAEDLKEWLQASPAIFRELKRDGWILPNPDFTPLPSEGSVVDVPDRFKPLSTQQEEAFEVLSKAGPESYLYGVTGAGKTEVYLHLSRQELEKGGSVLFLVPEIALTPQMERVFTERFGDLVRVLHSKVSDRERYDIWLKAMSGRVRIIVGARSALFAPLKHLSLILIDEEGEGSYKQDTQPVYDARIAARMLARARKARLIQGSATPSLGIWQRIQNHELPLASMPVRHSRIEPPKVVIQDMRQEFAGRNRSIFSAYLKKRLDEELQKGNQAILLVNRRGHSSFVMCRSCSHVVECPKCSISLTYHETSRDLHCHYCSHKAEVPRVCPSCGVQAIRFFGLGTQRAETDFARLFPGISHARVDTDTTRDNDFLEKTLIRMGQKKIQVLIGTQMVAKGLDFEDVTLVGILNADSSVKMPDFAASEKALQLFAQVAGRAGRALKSGEVILQTYQPEHPVFQALKTYQLEGFWEQELFGRKEAHFPPFTRLIKILATSEKEELASKACALAHQELKKILENFSQAELSPSQPSPIARLEGRYRYRCVLKTAYSKELWTHLREFRRSFRPPNRTRVKIIVDSDQLF